MSRINSSYFFWIFYWYADSFFSFGFCSCTFLGNDTITGSSWPTCRGEGPIVLLWTLLVLLDRMFWFYINIFEFSLSAALMSLVSNFEFFLRFLNKLMSVIRLGDSPSSMVTDFFLGWKVDFPVGFVCSILIVLFWLVPGFVLLAVDAELLHIEVFDSPRVAFSILLSLNFYPCFINVDSVFDFFEGFLS